jgi:hypothetical protein
MPVIVCGGSIGGGDGGGGGSGGGAGVKNGDLMRLAVRDSQMPLSAVQGGTSQPAVPWHSSSGAGNGTSMECLQERVVHAAWAAAAELCVCTQTRSAFFVMLLQKQVV